VVQDNLNTHTPAALYATFEPAEAKRIWDKLEFHPTPKHGSWLNMAEIELSVLSRQCLARRIAERETLEREAAELEKSFDDHLTHLLVHGFLHLLGYDHMNSAEAEIMEGLETRILAQLGLSDPYEGQDLKMEP
jgi:rRNA maturation RNase YbeY